MPIYGYTCCACNNRFDRYIRTHAQANCKRAIPNKDVALCPKCHAIGGRNLEGIKICQLTGGFEHTVGLIGSPTPDKAYDGKLAVNAGRNYGVVIDEAVIGIDKPQRREDLEYELLMGFDCDCDFCNETKKKLTDGEKTQQLIDRALANMLVRGASLPGVHVDNVKKVAHATEQKHFQGWLNDQDPSDE